jgi:hypothetical protein
MSLKSIHASLSAVSLAVCAACLSPTALASVTFYDDFGTGHIGVANAPESVFESAAALLEYNFLAIQPTPGNFVTFHAEDSTSITGAVAQIAGNVLGIDYTASATGTMLTRQVSASASEVAANVQTMVTSDSVAMDRLVIEGGAGAGTIEVSVHMQGSATLGDGEVQAVYWLATSANNPWGLNPLNVLESGPYVDVLSMDLVVDYGISSFAFSPVPPIPPVPGLPDPEPFPGIPEDRLLLPGVNVIDVTLTTTIDFTYGEAFYLASSLGGETGPGLGPFCAFAPLCSGPDDRSGASSFDLSAGYTLTLPEGATLSSASGYLYGTAAVPEPADWMLLLTGLGLVGLAVRRTATRQKS